MDPSYRTGYEDPAASVWERNWDVLSSAAARGSPRDDRRSAMRRHALAVAVLVFITSLADGNGLTQAQGVNNPPGNGCKDLPSWDALRDALRTARAQANGGPQLAMLGTIVSPGR